MTISALLMALLGLFLFSCSTSHDSLGEVQTISIEKLDAQTVQAESKNVVSFALDQTIKSVEHHDLVMDMEANGALGKIAGDDPYLWDGQWHTWHKVVAEGAFYAEFDAKVQYKDADGNVVKKPKYANYMYTEMSAVGTWGPMDPYGTRFDHKLVGNLIGLKTVEYEFQATGQYVKENYCIWNGKDALLKTNVYINIEKMTMLRAQPQSIALIGTGEVVMNPWSAKVVCDGSAIAKVTIFNDGVEVNSYDLDLSDLIQNYLPMPN